MITWSTLFSAFYEIFYLASHHDSLANETFSRRLMYIQERLERAFTCNRELINDLRQNYLFEEILVFNISISTVM